MTSKLLLRIAASMMFLHTIGHTIGAITWKNPPNVAVGQVINGMEDDHFDFMGRSVSLGAFFSGYGFIMILVLIATCLILWFISDETKSPLTIKLLTVLTVFLLAMGIIELIYFFPLPAILSLVAGFCTLIARFRIK
jgi:heme A synthase